MTPPLARVAVDPRGPQETMTSQTPPPRLQTVLLQEITNLTDRAAREAFGTAPTGIVADLLQLLKRVSNFIADASLSRNPPPTTNTLLQKVLNRLEKVEEKLETRPQTSYAAVAARGHSTTPLRTAQTALPTAIMTRKLREVRVRIADGNDKQALNIRPNTDILEKINQHFPSPKAIGVRRLPSGDMVIQTSTRETKEALTNKAQWITELGSSATVLPDLFPVFVHSVKVRNVDTTDHEKAVEYIRTQNQSLHPDATFVRVAWPKRVLTDGRIYSSLIVEVDSPEAANRLIDIGLSEGGELKRVERFEAGCKLKQCFNCH